MSPSGGPTVAATIADLNLRLGGPTKVRRKAKMLTRTEREKKVN